METFNFQRHTSLLPVSAGHSDRPMSADFNDPLKQSPCRRRPDTGMSCPLLKKDKRNRICENCGLIPGKGSKVYSDDEILLAIKNGLLDPKCNQKNEIKKKKCQKKCQWPGCDIIILKGRFCLSHGNTFTFRRIWFKKRYGKDATWEWLTRPVMKRGRSKDANSHSRNGL